MDTLTWKAEWAHCNSHVDVCDFINRRKLKPQQIISVNNDDRGNWHLLYYKVEEQKAQVSDTKSN